MRPGLGFATVFTLWRRLSRFAAFRKSRRIRPSLRLVADAHPETHSVKLGSAQRGMRSAFRTSSTCWPCRAAHGQVSAAFGPDHAPPRPGCRDFKPYGPVRADVRNPGTARAGGPVQSARAGWSAVHRALQPDRRLRRPAGGDPARRRVRWRGRSGRGRGRRLLPAEVLVLPPGAVPGCGPDWCRFAAGVPLGADVDGACRAHPHGGRVRRLGRRTLRASRTG